MTLAGKAHRRISSMPTVEFVRYSSPTCPPLTSPSIFSQAFHDWHYLQPVHRWSWQVRLPQVFRVTVIDKAYKLSKGDIAYLSVHSWCWKVWPPNVSMVDADKNGLALNLYMADDDQEDTLTFPRLMLTIIASQRVHGKRWQVWLPNLSIVGVARWNHLSFPQLTLTSTAPTCLTCWCWHGQAWLLISTVYRNPFKTLA